MALFTPVAQPTGIGPTGTIVVVTIPAGYRQRRLAKIVAAHTAGSLNHWTLLVSTDPAATDPLQAVAAYQNQRPLQTIADDNGGAGFTWAGAETRDWSTAPRALYCKVTADTGTDNNFTIGVLVDEGA